MQMYVISDNNDTYMGFRLVGVGGCVVHTEKEFSDALERVLANEKIGILLKMFRYIMLLEERMQDLFLLQSCLALPVAFEKLFDVLIIHFFVF